MSRKSKFFAMVEWNFKNKSGQSLIEVLIAMAIGTITILAAVTVLTLMLRVGEQDAFFQTATFLEQELVDNLLVTVERDWQEVAGTVSDKKYYLATTTDEGVFEIKEEEDGKIVNIDNKDYIYYIELDPVKRDSNGAISDSGSNDPSTKKVKVTVTWKFQGDDEISVINKYVTRSKNRVFRQTNWSGGPTGTDEVVSDVTNKFFESSGLDFVFQPGLLKVEGIE